jgi:hypothetical protein
MNSRYITFKIVISIFAFLVLTLSVSAINDPGHDYLYLQLTGGTLTGALNISSYLNILGNTYIGGILNMSENNITSVNRIEFNSDKINIGRSSVALGVHSIAIGIGPSAVGDRTIAIGDGAYCVGTDSIAIGLDCWAQGDGSIALGPFVQASGNYSIALGYGAQSTNTNSIAIGSNTINNLANSFEVGGDLTHAFFDTTLNTTGDICIEGGNCLSKTATATNYVPYTGATSNVSLGTNYIYAGKMVVGDVIDTTNYLLTINDNSPAVVKIRDSRTKFEQKAGLEFWAGNNKFGSISGEGVDSSISDFTIYFAPSYFYIKDYDEDILLTLESGNNNAYFKNNIYANNSILSSNVYVGGILDMTSGKIINLANGTSSQDAVTYSQLQAVEASSGNVSSSTTSTDNSIARFNGTTGKLIQNSLVTIDDLGTINTQGEIYSNSGYIGIYNLSLNPILGWSIDTTQFHAGIDLSENNFKIISGLSTDFDSRTDFVMDVDGNILMSNNVSIGGTLDMTSGKITNLANGTSSQDAVTKSQLDAIDLSGNLSNYVPYEGATSNVDLGTRAISNVNYIDSYDVNNWAGLRGQSGYAYFGAWSNETNPQLQLIGANASGDNIGSYYLGVDLSDNYNFKIGSDDSFSGDYFVIEPSGNISMSQNLVVDGGYLKVGDSISGDRLDLGRPAYNTEQVSFIVQNLGNFVWLENTARLNVLSLSIGRDVTPQTTDLTFSQGAIIHNENNLTLQIIEDLIKLMGNVFVNTSLNVTGNISSQADICIESGNCLSEVMTGATDNWVNESGDSMTGYLNLTGNLNVIGNITGNISASQVKMNIDFELKDWYDSVQSAGRLSGGEIIDNEDGTVTVQAGRGLIKNESSTANDGEVCEYGNCAAISDIQYVTWEENSSVTLTDNAYNYIYYDGSDGTMKSTTNFYAIDYTQDFTVGRVYRMGTEITIRLCGTNLWNFNRRVQLFGEEVFPIKRASGMILSATGTRNIQVTGGVLWAELVNRFTTDTVNTATTGNFTYWYRDGASDFTRQTGQTQINNLNYDDGDGTLGTLDNNRYGVHWVYVVHDSSVHVVYGTNSYTLSQAQLATPPSSIPGLLNAYGTLVGKIIILKSASSFAETSSAFTTTFSTSLVQNHNDLSGLQGGVAGEYYHLNNSEYLELQGLSDNYVPYTGATANVNLGSYNFTTTGFITMNGSLVQKDITGSCLYGISSIMDNGTIICATQQGSGDGNVSSSSSTDNAIARYDGETGLLIQNSGVTIDDLGTINTQGEIYSNSGYIGIYNLSLNPILGWSIDTTQFHAGIDLSENNFKIISGLSTDFDSRTDFVMDADGNILMSNNVSIGGTLNMSNNKIINLANGTDSQDAVTFSQLQSVNNSIVDNYVNESGDTMTGELIIDNDLNVTGTAYASLFEGRQYEDRTYSKATISSGWKRFAQGNGYAEYLLDWYDYTSTDSGYVIFSVGTNRDDPTMNNIKILDSSVENNNNIPTIRVVYSTGNTSYLEFYWNSGAGTDQIYAYQLKTIPITGLEWDLTSSYEGGSVPDGYFSTEIVTLDYSFNVNNYLTINSDGITTIQNLNVSDSVIGDLNIPGNVGIGGYTIDGLHSLGINGDTIFNTTWVEINSPTGDYADLGFTLDNWVTTSAGMQLDSSGNFNIYNWGGTAITIYPDLNVLMANNLNVTGNIVVGGTLNMSNNKITNLANGTSSQDAVTFSQLQSVNNSIQPNTDTWWNITGSNYLINSSNILELNETKLNDTFVRGPLSSINNAIATFDNTTGKIIKSNSIFIDDSNNLNMSGSDIVNVDKIIHSFGVIIGDIATTSFYSVYPIAIGNNAEVRGIKTDYSDYPIAIGENSSAKYDYSIAIGYNASASAINSVSIGSNAYTSSANAVLIGTDSYITGINSIGLGSESNTYYDNSISIGYQSMADAEGSIAIGSNSDIPDSDWGAYTYGINSLAMLSGSNAIGDYSIAIGYKAFANEINSIAIGPNTVNNIANSFMVAGSITDTILETNLNITGEMFIYNSSELVFKVNSTGAVFADGGYSTPATDLAEKIPTKEKDLLPGDVVIIDIANEESIKKSNKAYDTLVAGVISTKPGLKLGETIPNSEYVALSRKSSS